MPVISLTGIMLLMAGGALQCGQMAGWLQCLDCGTDQREQARTSRHVTVCYRPINRKRYI